MTTATVISLAEWRAVNRPPDDDDMPPAGPFLRVVGEDERPGERFRLDVFLARAEVVMAERRPPLRVVAGGPQAVGQ
jgi:hypothetical protein